MPSAGGQGIRGGIRVGTIAVRTVSGPRPVRRYDAVAVPEAPPDAVPAAVRKVCGDLRRPVATMLMLADLAAAQPELRAETRVVVDLLARQAAELSDVVDALSAEESGDEVAAGHESRPIPQARRSTDQATAGLTADRLTTARLTRREHEVLRRITAGQSTGEIAGGLGIAMSTARGHVQNVLVKLGVRSRLKAAAVAAGSMHIGSTPAGPISAAAARADPW